MYRTQGLNFFFKGIKKMEEDELKKVGLIKQVITENLRRTSIENRKFYSDKGSCKLMSILGKKLKPNNFYGTCYWQEKIDEIFISGNEVVSILN
jgi:hypothetical protein